MSNVCFYYCRTVPVKILIHLITNTPSKLPSNSRQISASKGKLDSIWNILSLKTTYHSLTSLIRKPKGQNQVQATERGRDCMKFGTKRRAWSKVLSVLWRCLCPEMDTDEGDSVLILKSFLRWKKYLANCDSLLVLFNPFTAKCGQRQVSTKFPNVIFQNCEKQIASCEITGRELSFEWSHHRI